MTMLSDVSEMPSACRFAPEAPPSLKSWLNDAGMRTAGRVGVGLSRLLGSRAGEALGIITYHRIAPHVPGLPWPLHNVTPDRFHEQLSGLLAAGFSFWSLRRVIDCHERGEPVPGRTVVVTFDDGFETVYHNAFPILRELRIPATIFVNTAYLDSDGPFPFDVWGVAYEKESAPEIYRPLTTAQCREMQASGWVDLGAHTHTHHDFRGRPDDFLVDLEINVSILRGRFGVSEVTFAFPYGSPHRGFAGGELAEAAKRAGVCCALTTEAVSVDVRSDPFYWGRFNAFSWDSSATLAAKLKGWYSWAPQLRQWLGRMLRRDGRYQAAPGGQAVPKAGPA
jgi:peptidoglycan/xylan/chitin deacetylase (PgdA/CDA1 family)